MRYFRFQPTSKAEWYELVKHARDLAGYNHNDNLDNYLVLTLEHFTTSKTLASTIIALDFLNANHSTGQLGAITLRDVGDHCLILSGLFPERVKRKNVSLEYLISIGKNSYLTIAHHDNDHVLDSELFYELSIHFIGLMDILHHMRCIRS